MTRRYQFFGIHRVNNFMDFHKKVKLRSPHPAAIFYDTHQDAYYFFPLTTYRYMKVGLVDCLKKEDETPYIVELSDHHPAIIMRSVIKAKGDDVYHCFHRLRSKDKININDVNLRFKQTAVVELIDLIQKNIKNFYIYDGQTGCRVGLLHKHFINDIHHPTLPKKDRGKSYRRAKCHTR